MQSKLMPHPVACAFSWATVMFVIALSFLFAKHLWAGLTGEQSVQLMITGDQWLSVGIFLAVSFVAGFLLAWNRRHRQSRSIDTELPLGANDV